MTNIKEGLTPIRLDVPQFVHDQLMRFPGSKKMNAEQKLIVWAKREMKRVEEATEKENEK